MTQTFDRSIVGYSPKDTHLLLAAWNNYLTTVEEERTRALSEASRALTEIQSDLSQMEAETQAWQAKYYRLSGALDRAAERVSILLHAAEEEILNDEEKRREQLAYVLSHHQHLRATIAGIPAMLDELIGHLGQQLDDAQTERALTDSDSVSPRDEMPASEWSGLQKSGHANG